MATLDELVVRIKADASQLEREMKRANQVVQQSSGRMGSSLNSLTAAFRGLVPALGAAALVNFAKQSIDAAGRITDLGDRIGIATGTLLALEKDLVASGSSLEDFATSINLMNANIGQAVSGNAQLREMFLRLGLSVEDLKRLSPEGQFYAIANALGRVGTQFEQTEIGRAVFGRGFAALIPLIKQANGNLEETVGKLKETDKGLAEATARVDEFGDAMSTAAIGIRNAFVEALGAVLTLTDAVGKAVGTGEEFKNARLSNYGGTSAAAQIADDNRRVKEYQDKQRAMGFPAAATFLGSDVYGPNQPKNYGTPFGPNQPAKPSGGGTKQLSDAEKELNRIREEGARITERNRTAYEKYADAVIVAQKALTTGAIDQTTYQRELARLQTELADATEDGMGRAKDATDELAVSIRSSLANAFESALFDADNFSDGMTQILDGIARQIARKAFIDPLSDSLSNSISGAFGGGIGKILGFADGGSPPVGVPSVVGERGPEIFVPKSAGTVIPNHALGGRSVTVTQVFHMSPGLQGTVAAEVRRAAPEIAAAAKAAVFQSIERGGTESRLVNRKS